MQRIRRSLRGFFFPPTGSPRWIRILPYATLGALTLVVLIAGVYAWDYTNSPAFCGTACHTMPPEYTAYLLSPHSRIDCVECHIGRGFIATRITRKAGDLQHIVATLFRTYEFPIRAESLRPARETCERCHSPQKFSDDSLRTILHFGDDRENTPTTTYLVLRTGGGSRREGLGRGIHWHIENPILYLALDPEEQEIPYVRVMNEDGSTTEFVDVEADLDVAEINPDDLEEMDCITCHNRITHLVLTPEATVDQLMARRIISPEIPEIRRRAVAAYAAAYESNDAALQALAGLETYYQQAYPDFYDDHTPEIQAAVAALQQAYQNSVFPHQNSDWTTHPNNIGHEDSPGCFRCHDGKHLNPEGEAIRLECNLCHAIPVVAGPPDFVAQIELSRGIEPQSHLNANWITLHRDVFDATCANCHTTADPGGVSNASFCSNSACHGSAWEYAGFDAPRLREILSAQLPTATPPPTGGPLTFEATIGPLLTSRCGSCHGGASPVEGFDLTTYSGALAGGSGGPAVIPGDPEGSLLVQKQSGEQRHFGQLTPEELDRVVEWIAAGAPED
ncbi:MAG TPA: c-type cytochrome domain-containing protein [Anaerolineales bacterium]|nr:c-type cytochrome domain-containing protein [Anaerolineales bacterium]